MPEYPVRSRDYEMLFPRDIKSRHSRFQARPHLIHHHDLHAAEVGRPLPQDVQEAPRSRYDDLVTAEADKELGVAPLSVLAKRPTRARHRGKYPESDGD